MNPPDVGKAVLVAWTIFALLAYVTYSVLMHARYGQTLGKMANDVRVLNKDEDRLPTITQAILRYIGEIGPAIFFNPYVILLILTNAYSRETLASNTIFMILGCASLAWYVIEIATMLTSKKRRALHDLIAGTVVVRTKPILRTVGML